MKIFEWFKANFQTLLAIWIAFVFLQSLFFKFSNSYETQHIFGTLGAWAGLPWFAHYGGYSVGVVELVAALLLFTGLRAWGAVIAFEVMSGAIMFHLFTPLGVVMPVFGEDGVVTGNDGGTLFVMACLTWLCAAALIVTDWLSRDSRIRRVLSPRLHHNQSGAH